MSVINLFLSARDALAERHRRRRTYDELASLDDRSLADIGIHRTQIPAIAEEAAFAARQARIAARAKADPRTVNGLDWLPRSLWHAGPRAM